MDAFILRRLDDFGRGEADAVIDHVHADVARAHRDLLGAVGMAIEAGLADQEFQPAAELARYALDLGAQLVERRWPRCAPRGRRRSARDIRRTPRATPRPIRRW